MAIKYPPADICIIKRFRDDPRSRFKCAAPRQSVLDPPLILTQHAASAFDNYSIHPSEIHSHDNVMSFTFRVNLQILSCKQFSIKCTGPRLYSSTRKEATSFASTSTFKASYKLNLLNNCLATC